MEIRFPLLAFTKDSKGSSPTQVCYRIILKTFILKSGKFTNLHPISNDHKVYETDRRMFIQTEAVFINAVKYGDESVILTFFTQKEGLLAFTSRRRVKLMPLSIVEITFDYRSNRHIQYIREMRTIQPLGKVFADPTRTAVVMFLSEVLRYALKGEKQNLELYDFLHFSIQSLEDEQEHHANFHIDFLLNLLRHLGYDPQFDESLQKNPRITNHDERNSYTEILIGYYRSHLPAFPNINSLEVLKAIF